MITKILNLEGVTKLTKKQAISINGAFDDPCFCIRDFSICRQAGGYQECYNQYFICKEGCKL